MSEQRITREEYNSTEQRIIRIETMLALLCHHLGLNPRTGTHLSKDLVSKHARRDHQDD